MVYSSDDYVPSLGGYESSESDSDDSDGSSAPNDENFTEVLSMQVVTFS